MDTVINLVGASGSGKTTICKALEDLGVNIVKSYTTRKPRTHGEYGHEFVSGHWLDAGRREPDMFVVSCGCGFDSGEIVEKSNMVSYLNAYGETYFSVFDQYLGKGLTINTVDQSGAERAKLKLAGLANVITIYLMVGRDERIRRMMECREQLDMSRRLQKDYTMFASSACDYVVDGERSVEEIVDLILEIGEKCDV